MPDQEGPSRGLRAARMPDQEEGDAGTRHMPDQERLCPLIMKVCYTTLLWISLRI